MFNFVVWDSAVRQSSVVQEGLEVKPVILYVKGSQLRLFGNLSSVLPK